MKRLFFLTLGMFAVGNSSFMIAGLLPHIGHTIGQPISVTSQGITAFSLTYLFSAPFFSVVLANQSAKRTLQAALLIFLLGSLITLTSESIVLFLLGRVVTAVGAGIFNPLCVGIAVQLGNQAAKGKVLSLIWGANSAGVVFGVPLGVYLSSKSSWQASIAYVFFLAAIALIGFSMQKTEINLPAASSMKDRLRPLIDKDILSVIGISGLTSLASLGLYSYVTLLQTGTSSSLALALFFWGLGGFFGSSLVGFFVDRSKRPRSVMAFVLSGLMLAIAGIPFTMDLPYMGLLSFFLWGAFGWSTTAPQQHILFELCASQKTILSALNSSAIGLGSALGTVIGGILVASGFNVSRLPFLAATVVMGTLAFQLGLIRKFK